jgi:endonuclease YncB( thermonuclease family)
VRLREKWNPTYAVGIGSVGFYHGAVKMKKLVMAMAIVFVSTAVYAQTYTVEEVIDAATLKLTNGEEVRLIGIQVPKIGKAGQEAEEFVNDLLQAKEPHLHFEVKLIYDAQERDERGRLLAYAYKDMGRPPIDEAKRLRNIEYETIDGNSHIFINAAIIKSGHGSPLIISPNVKHADLFKELHQEAREEKRGLWKDADIEPAARYREVPYERARRQKWRPRESELIEKARNYVSDHVKTSEKYKGYSEWWFGCPDNAVETNDVYMFQNPLRIVFIQNFSLIDGPCQRFFVTMDEDGGLTGIEDDNYCGLSLEEEKEMERKCTKEHPCTNMPYPAGSQKND